MPLSGSMPPPLPPRHASKAGRQEHHGTARWPQNGRILLAMYGPAADVKEKSHVRRFGTDAVMYSASCSRLFVSCGP